MIDPLTKNAKSSHGKMVDYATKGRGKRQRGSMTEPPLQLEWRTKIGVDSKVESRKTRYDMGGREDAKRQETQISPSSPHNLP